MTPYRVVANILPPTFKRTQSCLEEASGVETEAVTLRPKSPGSGVFTTAAEEDARRGCGLDPPLDVGGPLFFSLKSVMDEDILKTELGVWTSEWRSGCRSPSTTTWHGEPRNGESAST